MFGTELNIVQIIAIAILPILFAIVVHEVAHGWVAKKFGDNTAFMLGRLTLNPFKHIDPVGTILVPLLMLIFFKFAFGWAKPVPVDWRNLNNPKRDMVFVAAAGPFSNLLMAIGWGLIIHLAVLLPNSLLMIKEPLIYMGAIGIFVNVILMVFNLVPLPPLDGGRVAVGLLPPRLSYMLSQLEPYGLIIIVLLLVSGFFGGFLMPIIFSVISIIEVITGLPEGSTLNLMAVMLQSS
jgi:Zn-dependent protease